MTVTSERIRWAVSATALVAGLATLALGDFKAAAVPLLLAATGFLMFAWPHLRRHQVEVPRLRTDSADKRYIAYFSLVWLAIGIGAALWGMVDPGGFDKILLLLLAPVALFIAGMGARILIRISSSPDAGDRT